MLPMDFSNPTYRLKFEPVSATAVARPAQSARGLQAEGRSWRSCRGRSDHGGGGGRRRLWRLPIEVVRRASEARLAAVGSHDRDGLVGTLREHRGRRFHALAATSAGGSRACDAFRYPVTAECGLDAPFHARQTAGPSRRRLRRAHRGQRRPGRFRLASTTTGRPPARSVPALDGLRDLPQLDDLPPEPLIGSRFSSDRGAPVFP